jgi:hypothetical protein
MRIYSAAQIYIGTAVPVYQKHNVSKFFSDIQPAKQSRRANRESELTPATVAITALKIPITLFHPIAIPFPVPLCALGRTSGVYAYSVP